MMLTLIADTLPQTFVSAQQDQLGWMLIAVIIGGIITVSWLSSAQPETRYHYQPGRKVATAPTKRPASLNPCTCGECCCCDPTTPDAVKVPPVLLSFGGMGSLPVYPSAHDDDLPSGNAKKSKALPDWLAPEQCGACGRTHDAVCFVCPTCQILIPQHRIELVFDLCSAGRLERAWSMAEALIKDVKHYRATVTNTGERISYSKN